MLIKFVLIIVFCLCLRSVQGSITRPNFSFIEKTIKLCFYDSIIKNCQKNPLTIQQCKDKLNNMQSGLIERCKETVSFYMYDRCEEEFYNSLSEQTFNNELKQCRKVTQNLVQQYLPSIQYKETITKCFSEILDIPNNRTANFTSFLNKTKENLIACGDISPNKLYACEYNALMYTSTYDFPLEVFKCIENKSQVYFLQNFPRINKIPFSVFDGLFRSCANFSMFKECPEINKNNCLRKHQEITETMVNFCRKASTDRLMAICEELALITNDIETNSNKYKDLLDCKKFKENTYVVEYNKLFL